MLVVVLLPERRVSINRQDATLSTKDTATPTSSHESHADAPTDAKVTTAIVDRLADRLGRVRYELWFSGDGCVEFRDGKVFIQSESSFSLNRLQNKFGLDLRSIVNAICGAHVEIDFSVRAPKPAKVAPGRKPLSNQACLFEVAGEDAGKNTKAADAVSASNLQADASGGGSNASQYGSADQAVRENANNSPKVQFADSASHASHGSHSTPPAPQAVAPSSNSKSTRPVAKPGRSLKTFWFGSSNRIARAGIEQVSETPGQFSPLLIYGPSGTGKTHLLEATTNFYRQRLRKKRCIYLSAEQFTSLFVGSLRDNRGLPVFRQKYRDLDLFAVDDIQFLAGKTATLNEFQFTIDTLIRQGKQVIVSADRSPMELSNLGADLMNRLAGGLSCPLAYPDLEGRKFIIGRMCKDRNFHLGDDVIEMIAGQITRDVRRLSGAVNRLRAVALSMGQTNPSVEFAADALHDLMAMSNLGTSIMGIENAVCELTGMKPADLRSSSRRKTVSSARMLAMYLAREHTNSALSEIGDYFGNRSHSTVIAAQKKIGTMLAEGAMVNFSSSSYPVKEAVEQIRSKLRLG